MAIVRDRISLGRRGEDLAAQHLKDHGYRIVDRNVRFRHGELDIVALDGPTLVFVEVRTVRAGAVIPEESVTRKKQRQVAALAALYLQQHSQEDADWRADVVAIEIARDGGVARIDHLVSAMEIE